MSHCTTTAVYIQISHTSLNQQTATFNEHAVLICVPAANMPSNANYMLYIPIISCANMEQLCQYIYLILTHYNK